ncbi:MAG: SRPBCC family protein [Steroidobacteraceae bacterium]
MRNERPRRAAAAAFAAACLTGHLATAFEIDPVDAARLHDGQIIVQSVVGRERQNRGWVNAAVWIDAEPEAVWSVMTDCPSAPLFVPGMKRCTVLEQAADRSWEVIEHEVKPSAFLPRMHYVFRASYRRPERIDFRQVRGDFERNEGTWELTRPGGYGGTIVKYSVVIEPRFYAPRWLVRVSLEKNLPELMRALRERVGATTGG